MVNHSSHRGPTSGDPVAAKRKAAESPDSPDDERSENQETLKRQTTKEEPKQAEVPQVFSRHDGHLSSQIPGGVPLNSESAKEVRRQIVGQHLHFRGPPFGETQHPQSSQLSDNAHHHHHSGQPVGSAQQHRLRLPNSEHPVWSADAFYKKVHKRQDAADSISMDDSTGLENDIKNLIFESPGSMSPPVTSPAHSPSSSPPARTTQRPTKYRDERMANSMTRRKQQKYGPFGEKLDDAYLNTGSSA